MVRRIGLVEFYDGIGLVNLSGNHGDGGGGIVTVTFKTYFVLIDGLVDGAAFRGDAGDAI